VAYVRIENATYRNLTENDLFVCAIGYEPRSLYLLKENMKSRTSKNTLLLFLNRKFYIGKLKDELDDKCIVGIDCVYNDGSKVAEIVKDFYNKKSPVSSLNIDYSSMPRNWYYAFPKQFANISDDSKMFFWYVAGDYDKSKLSAKEFPTAGIKEVLWSTGSACPSNSTTRYHLMGLGYDGYRSEAIYNITEPNNLYICYSFNPYQNQTRLQVNEKNRWLIANSIKEIDLPLNDFSGMVSKLCELVYSLLQGGQVIIVPDGTKPLIMAMSILPDILTSSEYNDKLTCLAIERSEKFTPVEVIARQGEVFGFKVL